jgi:hypothetical protein
VKNSLRKVETVRRGDLIFEAADGSLPTFTARPTFATLGIKHRTSKHFVLYKTCVYDEKMDAATGATTEEDAHVSGRIENTFAHVYDMRTLKSKSTISPAAQFVGWSKEGMNPSLKYKRLRELILKRTSGKDPHSV